MKHTYICDMIKLLWAILGFAVFVGLVCGCMVNHRYVLGAVFLVLAAIYAYMAVKNASIIRVDDETVEKRVLGKTVLSFKWSELNDVGLVNKRFIYFSREEMGDGDRARMCFNWPPEDKIYFRAGKNATNTVERLWNRRGKLFIRYKSKRFG